MYSSFVILHAIAAIKWGPHENWAAVATVAFAAWGLMVQIPMAIIITFIALIQKKLLFKSLSLMINLLMAHVGWVVSALSILIALIVS
jgi:hypothetical protein